MNDDMTKRRDKLAEKRSKRQCSTGNPDLDRAISWYLKIGFEDGFDAAVAEMQAQVDELGTENHRLRKIISSQPHEENYKLMQERDSLKQALDVAVKYVDMHKQAINEISTMVKCYISARSFDETRIELEKLNQIIEKSKQLLNKGE